MSEPAGLPGITPPGQRPAQGAPPQQWGDQAPRRLQPEATEPTLLPIMGVPRPGRLSFDPGRQTQIPVLYPQPVPQSQPTPLDREAPLVPDLRNHPDYARLSKRHAMPGWLRFFSWFARIFRSDDVASRVTRASAGAQRPVTTGRRVVVVGASGGTGTTSITVGLARTLAAARNAPVAVLTTESGNDLASRLNTEPIPRAASDRPAASFAEQMSIMMENGRLAVIRPRENAAAMARGLARFFAVTVVDAGQHPPVQLTAEAHSIVIIASASAAGTTAVARTATEMRATGVNPAAIQAVLVPRTPGDDSARHAKRLHDSNIHAFALPYDRHIAGGAALHLRLMAENTQVVLGELAAATMNTPDR